MKTTSKVLVGSGALDYYVFAKHKLSGMNLNTGMPVMKKTLKLGNATIIIQKGESHDKILIIARPPRWLALGVGDINGPVYSQLAEAKKPAGPWKEPPVGDVVDSKNTFPGQPATTARPTEPYNIMVLGDGRYGLEFDSFDSTDTRVTGFFSYNTQRKFMGLLQLTGLTANGNVLPAPMRYSTFPVQQYWAADERVGNDNALQLATLTMQQSVEVAAGGGLIQCSIRFMAMDMDYGPLDSHQQGSGFRTSFPIVDTETGGWVVGTLNNPGLARIYFCFLTPKTILVGTLGTFYDTAATASFDQKIGVSLDGGKTWALSTFNSNAYLGVLTGSSGIERWVALGSTAALWMGLYGFTTKEVDDGFGHIHTETDDAGLAIFKVTVNGGHTLVCRPDRDIAWPLIFSSSHYVAAIGMYVLGRDLVLLVAAIVSNFIDDQREPDLPYNGYRAQNTRTRTYCCRSFDGGASWDEPTYSGFYGSGTAQAADADTVTTTVNGVTRTSSYIAYPGTYMFRLYCHKPYNNAQDQGTVYVTAVNLTGNLLEVEDTNITVLFKSTDACRTFQRVGPIGAKPFFRYSDNDGSHYSAPVYPCIVDSGAPIDPIFPWRVDARITPPDWWMGAP